MDFSNIKPTKEKHDYLFKCNTCGRETVFVVKVSFKDDEPVTLPDGRVKRKCGGRYVFVRKVTRT